MKYDWLLFDADNTLFDFTGSSRLAFEQLLTNAGHTFTETYYQTYKEVNDIVWEEFENGQITAVELRIKRFQLFFDATDLNGNPGTFNSQYLAQLVQQTRLLDGALELLQHLHGKCQMAIITNGLKEVQRPRIREANVGHYFDTIVVSDEIGVAKPDPAFFDFTFQQIQQPARERVLVVGDNIGSDIKGGINYGLDTCWYNPSGKTNASAIEPRYEIDNLNQIHQVISA